MHAKLLDFLLGAASSRFSRAAVLRPAPFCLLVSFAVVSSRRPSQQWVWAACLGLLAFSVSFHIMAWIMLLLGLLGVFAGPRFFALSLRGGSSPCDLLFACVFGHLVLCVHSLSARGVSGLVEVCSPLGPFSLPRSGFEAVDICAGRRFFARCGAAVLRPVTHSCFLSPTPLHLLLSPGCVLDRVCARSAVGVSAGRLFFTLCFRDGSAPCPPFFSLSLLLITPPRLRSGSYILLSPHSWEVPRLCTARAALAAFLSAVALDVRPDVVRASGLSGLFGVWLALPGSGLLLRLLRFPPIFFLSSLVFPALISDFCRYWALAARTRSSA